MGYSMFCSISGCSRCRGWDGTCWDAPAFPCRNFFPISHLNLPFSTLKPFLLFLPFHVFIPSLSQPSEPLWALEDAPRIFFPGSLLFQAGQSQLSQPGSVARLFSDGSDSSRCSFQQNTGNVQGYSRPIPDKEPRELPCCVWGFSHHRLPWNPSRLRSPSRCFWVSGHLSRSSGSSSRSVGSGSGRGCGARLGSFYIPGIFR